MKFHIKNKETDEKIMNIRGRDFTKLPVGHDPNLEIFIEVEEDKPNYNSKTHKLVTEDFWSLELHEEYSHCRKYKITYDTEQLANEEIISTLNSELGNYLDTEYPVWERVKHLAEYQQYEKNGVTEHPDYQDRIDYLQSLLDWVTTCRAERDTMENALTDNGTLPSFSFSVKPTE